ncbi:MAG: PrsW family intramembrane metalloprotease [Chloroflexi bacterium]|nr:PrsW family intramembrane metalloprotease [Chloroflexota bacterium]
MRFIVTRSWLQIALGGVTLFVLGGEAFRLTGNPNFLPSLILLGAFVVPVSFAAYFYRQEHLLDRQVHGGIPLVQATLMFLVGGVAGTFIAGVLEYTFDQAGLLDLTGASVIEEGAKLIFPVIVFLQARYRSEADGLLFGVATGMGFAAFETMGYGLVSLIRSSGDFTELQSVLVVRGLLSPLGHAAWTGLVCGAMWHYRRQGVMKLAVMTTAYFMLAVALHALWNLAAATRQPVITFPATFLIGAVGLYFVFRHLRHARRAAAS